MSSLRDIGLALLVLAAAAAEAEPVSGHPGGVVFLELGAATSAPDVRFGDSHILVQSNDAGWQAVVGVPLDTAPGDLEITVDGTPATIRIKEHAYSEQRLTIKNQDYVSPQPAQLERIARERKIIDTAIGTFRAQPMSAVTLAAPVAGPRSSSFGLRRFYNDEPRSPHKGMDIAAPQGTEITAPRGGLVSATGDFFFNGNTVILDHGQGLITMYCHLDRIDAEEGETLEAGAPLGTVGSTGRVTGPHLHFGVYLNGTAIDPAMLLE